MVEEVLFDARGYIRPEQTKSYYRKGKPSPNKGKTYPPEPPTAADIVKLIQACPNTAKGRRQRALMTTLWRTGMRISEALDLVESDLNQEEKTILIRRGKGGKRRTVGLDDWGWVELDNWLQFREQFPVGAVFCVVTGPTAGRAINPSDIRKYMRHLCKETGLRKRVSPHSFRHGFAVETISEDGIGLNDVSRVLGHSSLVVTSIYLRSISDGEIAKKFSGRQPPVIPIAHL